MTECSLFNTSACGFVRSPGCPRFFSPIRYMSGFKGRVKMDISRWRATKYATILPVGCLNICPSPHSGIIGGMPPRYICFALWLKSWHRWRVYHNQRPGIGLYMYLLSIFLQIFGHIVESGWLIMSEGWVCKHSEKSVKNKPKYYLRERNNLQHQQIITFGRSTMYTLL